MLLQSAQSIVLLGLVTGLGLLLTQHLGLGAPLLKGVLAGKSVTTVSAQALALLGPALLLGLAASAVVLLLKVTAFWPRLPPPSTPAAVHARHRPHPGAMETLPGLRQWRFDEEPLLGLFVPSLLAWALALVARR